MTIASEYYRKKLLQEEKERRILVNLQKEAAAGNCRASRIYDRIIQIQAMVYNVKKPGFPSRTNRKLSDFIDNQYLRVLKLEEKMLIDQAGKIGRPSQYMEELRKRSRNRRKNKPV